MKAEDLYQIGILFESLNWPLDDRVSSQFPLLLTRFCRTWERLTHEQRRLILQLVPSYAWIPPKENEERISRLWFQLLDMLPPGTVEVAIVNLPRKKGGPKSYDSLFYLAKGYDAMIRLAPVRTEFIASVRQYKGSSETALVFLDDYVGSGGTIGKALKMLRKLSPQAKYNAIFALAIVAQRSSVEYLKGFGCTVLADMMRDKAISDSAKLDVPESLKIMDDIGRMLGVSKDERLGYGASEALVSMTRTPNNTFPVFWTTRKVRKVGWDPPFPRYTRPARNISTEDLRMFRVPMPSCSDGPVYTIECRKVMECIRDQKEIELLVEYKIPYSRILHYLRELLSREQIERLNGNWRLTPGGHQTLQTPPEKTPNRLRYQQDEEPTRGTTKRLHIPEESV